MKRLMLVVTLCLVSTMVSVFADDVTTVPDRVLFVYDEVNENSAPYIEWYREGFNSAGIAFDEMPAAKAKDANLAEYGHVVIHGMVIAFNSKSAVRDWLKKAPELRGMKVSLLVTANRWFLKDLDRQLRDSLKKDGADVIDAVSSATKDLDESAKRGLVTRQIKGLR